MHGNGRCAILEVVYLFVGLVRKLSFFPHRDKSGFQFYGRGRREDEPASINPNHSINAARFEAIGEQVDAAGKEARICQDRSNIFKLNAGFWKIRDGPDGSLNV